MKTIGVLHRGLKERSSIHLLLDQKWSPILNYQLINFPDTGFKTNLLTINLLLIISQKLGFCKIKNIRACVKIRIVRR